MVGLDIIVSLLMGFLTFGFLILICKIIISMMKPVEIKKEDELKDYQTYRIFYGCWLILSIMYFIYFNIK